MTKTQVIKAMKAAGIKGEVRGRGEAWEVTLDNDKVMRAFGRKVANAGGFKTGWGGWILRPNYRDNGDWNDRASRHHY